MSHCGQVWRQCASITIARQPLMQQTQYMRVTLPGVGGGGEVGVPGLPAGGLAAQSSAS